MNIWRRNSDMQGPDASLRRAERRFEQDMTQQNWQLLDAIRQRNGIVVPGEQTYQNTLINHAERRFEQQPSEQNWNVLRAMRQAAGIGIAPWVEPSEEMDYSFLLIPDFDFQYDPSGIPYPGNILPGYYTRAETVDLLRRVANNPEAVRFIADMLER